MKMRFAALSIIVAIAVQVVHGKVYDSLDSLPSNRKYDFIVVGGGNAGSVVASRLTENSHFTVLLIEAGPNNEGVFDLQVPGLTSSINATYQWPYATEPQTHVNNRSLTIPRGHVLGGSSSINGMIYTRGSRDDYDSWAKITRDSGWSWNPLFSYAKKHEKWTLPVGGRNITGQYDPEFHGFSGKTLVSLRQSPPDAFEARVLQTTKDLKEFPFNIDPNSGRAIGVTWTQSTIGNGERCSAATAYLNAPARKRPNLDIVLNTQATRVLRSGTGKHLDIRTVELGPRSGGSTRKVFTATKELILSAGSINTPQILLLSGIGPRKELSALGIPIIRDLPEVGKGLSDHSVSPIAVWNTTGTLIPPPDEEAVLNEWKSSRSGPMTEFGRMQIIWSRIPSNATIWKTHSDPSSGKNAPHFEFYFYNDGAVAGASIILLTPKSRGSVTLKSTNPFDPPKIDLGYLSHPFDIQAIREGARILRRFFAGPAWSDYIAAPLTIGPEEPGFDEQVRIWILSTWHPVGTAAMSARGAGSGVLDPDLRLKGVKGLRVVDASAFPIIPTGHTQAGVYILAERAADLIKGSW